MLNHPATTSYNKFNYIPTLALFLLVVQPICKWLHKSPVVSLISCLLFAAFRLGEKSSINEYNCE